MCPTDETAGTELSELLRQAAFWADLHFWQADEYPYDAEPDRFDDEVSVTIIYRLPDDWSLHHQIGGRLNHLSLVAPDGRDWLLADDNDAHQFAALFRWDKLDALCRYLAETDPRFPYPGPGLALLCKYLVLTPADDIPRIKELIAVSFGENPDTDDFWPTADGVLAECYFATGKWIWRGEHLIPTLVDGAADPAGYLYSLRVVDDLLPEEFPFAEWKRVMKSIGVDCRPPDGSA